MLPHRIEIQKTPFQIIVPERMKNIINHTTDTSSDILCDIGSYSYSGAETGIFRESWANDIAADALGTEVAR